MNRKTRFGLFALLLCFGTAFFTSCEKQEVLETTSNELVEEEVIVPIEIDATVSDGALVFKDHTAFHEAMKVLDQVNLASRKAWEEKMGFQSIRSIYDQVIQDYYEGNSIDQQVYADLIDFSGSVPMLKDNDAYTASVLNRDNHVYVWGAIGTFRNDGSYWVMNGDKAKLEEVLSTKQADFENGVLVYSDNREGEQVSFRTCTSGIPNDVYSETHFINNGTSRGSSALQSWFNYIPTVTPANGNGTIVSYYIIARIRGISYRRTTNGNNWKTYSANHTMSWDFQVDHFDSATQTSTITNYSGQETHVNNKEVAKVIEILNVLTSDTWAGDNFYILNEVYDTPQNGNGTSHTTNYLTPAKITFSCD